MKRLKRQLLPVRYTTAEFQVDAERSAWTRRKMEPVLRSVRRCAVPPRPTDVSTSPRSLDGRARSQFTFLAFPRPRGMWECAFPGNAIPAAAVRRPSRSTVPHVPACHCHRVESDRLPRAVHRFFCASAVRFFAAADILRGPRLETRVRAFTGLRPFCVAALAASDDSDVLVASAPLRCAAHRAFWASEMRLRASGDMVRGPRLAVPPALFARDARGGAANSEPSEEPEAWLPPRLAAQYFFIRSPTALR